MAWRNKPGTLQQGPSKYILLPATEKEPNAKVLLDIPAKRKSFERVDRNRIHPHLELLGMRVAV